MGMKLAIRRRLWSLKSATGAAIGRLRSKRARFFAGEILEIAGLGWVVASAWSQDGRLGMLALGVALFAYGVSMDPQRGDSK